MSEKEKTGQQESNPDKNDSIWDRVCHVEIIIWNNEKAEVIDLDGIDIKFSITQILGRRPEGNMSVSLCGLSRDTANKIITLCSAHEALIKRKTMKLYAGYADPENKKYRGELLATMDITNATITSPPPDIWLQITAVYAGWLNDLKFDIDIMDIFTHGTKASGPRPDFGEWGSISEARPIILEDCLEKICDGLNKLQEKRGVKTRFKYDISHVDEYVAEKVLIPGSTRHFWFSGTLDMIPTEISKSYKVNAIWEDRDDDNIYLAVYPDPRYVTGIDGKEKNLFTRGSTIKFLDVDHGLIGIPKLKDAIKLECRCFLDGKIKAGDYVSVKSEMLPCIYEYGENIKPSNKTLAYNWGSKSWTRDKENRVKESDIGTIKAYQIMRIKYTGHLRGNEWYCDIEARRPTSVVNLTKDKAEQKPREIFLTEHISKKLKGWEYDEETGAMTKRT